MALCCINILKPSILSIQLQSIPGTQVHNTITSPQLLRGQFPAVVATMTKVLPGSVVQPRHYSCTNVHRVDTVKCLQHDLRSSYFASLTEMCDCMLHACVRVSACVRVYVCAARACVCT